MIFANLADGSFVSHMSSSLGGDCAHESPQFVFWDRTRSTSGSIFITDMFIKSVDEFSGYSKRIGWLIEPPSLSDTHYQSALELQNKFDVILTFDMHLVTTYPGKFRYYPFGGSWIAKDSWGACSKTKMVSMIASQKQGAEGHRLRHAIINRFPQYAEGMGVSVMGYGYRPVQSKLEGLSLYRYSVVVESCKHDDYFSEKLIDCLACGTIPIYWGCRNIGQYFDKSGIITFETLSQLESILVNVVSKQDYSMRAQAIVNNLVTAKQYRIADDWIVEHYPDLFEGCEVFDEQ